MKKIVWDWNGTLFDDVDLSYQCVDSLLFKYEKKRLDTVYAYRNVFGFPIIDYYKKAGFDFSKTPFSVLAQEYMDAYTPKSYACQLNSEAISALQYVLDQGGSQIILSASKIENLQAQLDCFHLDSYIESIWGIQDIYATSKIEIAKEFMKTCQDEVWFIGDSIHDYEVASSVNASCILVSCGHQSKERLETCHVPVFDSLLKGVKYIYERNSD